MKITKARLQEIILEELNEMSLGDEYGDDSIARIKHIRSKRARGQTMPHSTTSLEPNPRPVNPEAHMQAMVNATKMILKLNPDSNLMVDAGTYAAIKSAAPELLDRLTTSGGMR